jgi:hypothetical protein
MQGVSAQAVPAFSARNPDFAKGIVRAPMVNAQEQRVLSRSNLVNAQPSNLGGTSGAKALFPRTMNVAAEAATHKDPFMK